MSWCLKVTEVGVRGGAWGVSSGMWRVSWEWLDSEGRGEFGGLMWAEGEAGPTGRVCALWEFAIAGYSGDTRTERHGRGGRGNGRGFPATRVFIAFIN